MTKSAEEMNVHEAGLQSEKGQPARTSSPVYNFLPSAFQIRLQPLDLVRRSLSHYSLRSPTRIASLVMVRRESEDTLTARDEPVVGRSCLVDSEEIEVPGICWKFARHGKALHTEDLHHEIG